MNLVNPQSSHIIDSRLNCPDNGKVGASGQRTYVSLLNSHPLKNKSHSSNEKVIMSGRV